MEGTHDDTGVAQLTIQQIETGSNWSSESNQTITTNVRVQYHYPEKDKEKTEHTKTFTAQRGIAIRVKVPSELWAGEKQPLFAVLNGKHGANGSETGDMHYSFPFRWETSDPVIIYDVNNVPTDYRAPETDEEVVASTIATAAHKIKQNTSPLYLGDIVTTNGGIVYVRAIAENVPLVNGEYIDPDNPNAVLTTFKSDWFEVRVKEEIIVVDQDGDEELDAVALYIPDDGTNRGAPVFEEYDPLRTFSIEFEESLNPNIADSITAYFYNNATEDFDSYELIESGADTKIFEYDNEGVEIIVTLTEISDFDPEAIDVFSAEVYHNDLVNPSRSLRMEETDVDSLKAVNGGAYLQMFFPNGISDSKKDTIQIVISAQIKDLAENYFLVETGNDTKEFNDCIYDIRVSLPFDFSLTTSIDEIIVEFIYPPLFENMEMSCRLKETSAESNWFTSCKYKYSHSSDYPEPSDITFHKIRLKRWPGIIGENMTVWALSGDEITSFNAYFTHTSFYESDYNIIEPLNIGFGSLPSSFVENLLNTSKFTEIPLDSLSKIYHKYSEAEKESSYDLIYTSLVAAVAEYEKAIRSKDKPSYEELSSSFIFAIGSKEITVYGVDLFGQGT